MSVAHRARRVVMAIAACLFAAMPAAAPLHASGHGPVFGAATPTLGKGGWSIDQAWMGQVAKGPADTGALLRSMISFGVTEKIQLSASVPVSLGGGHAMPSGRMMAMMSGNRDFEALAGWRFHTRPAGTGARVESTIYAGALVPFDARRGGVAASPGGYVALATGYASRSHYFWAGASHQRNATRNGDRQGAVTTYSVVYGYRPPAWRREYPKPDVRLFVETVLDDTSAARHDGRPISGSATRVFLAGPTLLVLYKAYGVGGGVMFALHQRNSAMQPERLRFGVNVSYFFWPGRKGQ